MEKSNTIKVCYILDLKFKECVPFFQGHNIFANISSDEYSEVIQVLKQAILATDLSLHVQ